MIPTIRLDEENFQEIFETARKRIPLLYPEWTNFNENDSGIALLELFSWLKEVQEFHLNQVGLEHESVYLKLLGIERKEICPARTVVTCCSVKEETELPEGFQFHAGEIPFCSVERTRLFSGKLWRVRTGNTGRQGYVSEREWDGSDTGWKLPVFTEIPEYGGFLEMEFSGKMTGGQTLDSSSAFRKNGAQKEIRFQKSLSRWRGSARSAKITVQTAGRYVNLCGMIHTHSCTAES